MGVRLTCTYNSVLPDTQTQYTVEIHDKNGGGGSEFCLVRYKEPIISLEGQSREIFNIIQPSSCKFTMYVDNDAARNFVEDFAASTEEGRFFVIVRQGPITHFIGMILPQEVTVEVKSWPDYEFTVTATDALAALKSQAYVDSSGDPFDPTLRETIQDHLKNIFYHLLTKDFYTASAIQIIKDWSEATIGDNINGWYVKHIVFQQKTELNTGIVPFSCWDVLEYICKTFHFRLQSSYGAFVFEQLPAKIIGAYGIESYSINMSPFGSLSILDDVFTVGCEGEERWFLEGTVSQTFKPPLRTSTTIYNFKGFGAGYKRTPLQVTANSGLTDCNNDAGLVAAASGEARMRFTGTFEWVRGAVPGGYEDLALKVVFYLTIQIGSQYFNREFSGDSPIYYDSDFKPTEWSGTNENYAYWDSKKVLPGTEENAKYSLPFEIETLPIPAILDGEQLSICIEAKTFGRSGQVTSIPVEVYLVDMGIYIIDGQDENKIEDSYINTTILNSDKNRETVSVDLVFGDGPGKSDSRITSGPTDEDSEEWTSAAVGGPFTIQELSARSRLSVHKRMVKITEGTLEGVVNLRQKLSWCGDTWTLMKGKFETGRDRIVGEWANLQISPGGTKIEAIGTTRTDRSPGTTLVGGGGGGRYHHRQYTGPSSDILISDLEGFNPADWSSDDMAALVVVFRNGVKQRYGGTDVDGYTITYDGDQRNHIVPDPSWIYQSGEKIDLLMWQF